MRRMMVVRWAVAAAVVASGTSFGAEFAAPPLPPEVTFPSSKVVKVTEEGAVADGKTLCTEAIAKAIDECAAAGGGIVEFPKADGAYLTGRIKLKSNITLQVDEGAVVRFATGAEGGPLEKLYPLEKTRYEAVDVMNYSPLIYAYQCENIRITGKGTLDGQGQWWWAWARNPLGAAGRGRTAGSANGGSSGQGVGGTAEAKRLMGEYTRDRGGKFPLEERVFGDKNPGYRPCFIEPYECKNVVVEDVTIKNSPFWTVHPLYTTNFTLRNANVSGEGPNTDGCDPDSCNTVLIDHVTFNTGDDCIAIKSGRDGDGIRRNRPCENLTIRDCTMNGGHGAVTLGSETSAGIRHVLAENCVVDGPDVAIRLKSSRGRGGGFEDFMARNIRVKSVKKQAILITLRYGSPVPATAKNETTPVGKDLWIENLTCAAAPQAILIQGLEESPIEDVTLKNVNITCEKGASVDYVKGLVRENVVITPKSGEAWKITHSTGVE
ncbi:MAG TPA: glycoside hydrolase family 28 protein [Phycisphaerae bacterium]|nr:glycoside hydrolase family 28 protein [Phycisphaerae bacterium]